MSLEEETELLVIKWANEWVNECMFTCVFLVEKQDGPPGPPRPLLGNNPLGRNFHEDQEELWERPGHFGGPHPPHPLPPPPPPPPDEMGGSRFNWHRYDYQPRRPSFDEERYSHTIVAWPSCDLITGGTRLCTDEILTALQGDRPPDLLDRYIFFICSAAENFRGL